MKGLADTFIADLRICAVAFAALLSYEFGESVIHSATIKWEDGDEAREASEGGGS